MYTFPAKLKQKLEEKGWRPADLSKRSGVTKQNLSRILNNRVHSITGAPARVERETVLKIAHALDWDEDDALQSADFAPINKITQPRNFAEFVSVLESLGIDHFENFGDIRDLAPEEYELLLVQIAAVVNYVNKQRLPRLRTDIVIDDSEEDEQRRFKQR